MPRYIVRCGTMRTLHALQARDEYRRGQRVIARTPRGIELGEVLCEATPEAISYLKDPPVGNVQRLATVQDDHEALRITRLARDEFLACKRIIAELGLEMDLVDLEHVFGGERVVIYYISEDRIDFRELVKRLAHEFQTRIEMKQIGVRDEAKLLADYGDCGKPVCCNTHLVQMPPVSMKMAKLQKATLDPSKISGRCGRLKCCLRYEYDTYEEMAETLPPIGSDVVTQQGRGRVINQELLAGQLLVQMEDGRRIMITKAEVLSTLRRGKGKGNHSHEAPPSDPGFDSSGQDTSSPEKAEGSND
jgi:cell fate regulator YaaT (PSP1 superfamily)